jgi:uncharacterized OB-fold protein
VAAQVEQMKPLPDLDDPVSAPFWREAAQGRLSFQRCSVCGYLRWPAASLCPECWSPRAEWAPVSHDGEVWSFGVYERAFSAAFESDVPYVVALVQLDAGPRLIGKVVDVVPADVTVGMRVTAAFEAFADDAALVNFRGLRSD